MKAAHAEPLPLYEDLRRAARRRLPRLIFDFMDGAAGTESAMARNAQAFDRATLMPRVLIDPPPADLSARLPDGSTAALPFGCAPMGMCNLAGPASDEAMARAAAHHRFPVCVSTASSTPLERMAELSQGQAWFQLYVTGSVEAAEQLADRAYACGYRNLVLTVDVPRLGKRPRDLRNGFRTPLRWQARHVLDFALHPRWSLSTLVAGIPTMANFSGPSTGGYDRTAARRGADWDFLERLRQRWRASLIVKGVMCPEDAMRIRDLGADAIYLSNHGGRQLDSAPATLEALPAVRAALGPGVHLIMDGGVRSGEDVIKARALGADFVMMGRPFLYACAAGGAAALQTFIAGFADDIGIAMAQVGLSGLSQIDGRVLARHQLGAIEHSPDRPPPRA